MPEWKSFNYFNTPQIDGFRVGLFAPGRSSFIGRAKVNDEYHIGRIQTARPIGLFYSLDGSSKFTNSSIEYLVKNDKFVWKNSSNGVIEVNAVTVSAKRNLPYYIGRIMVNGFAYLGTIVRVLGVMYYVDENGIERTTDCYEVLTCQGKFFLHLVKAPL